MTNLINNFKNQDSTTKTGLVIVSTIIVPFLLVVVFELINGTKIYL